MNYLKLSGLLIALLLFSCQQHLRISGAQDYSIFLPEKQLLYLTLTVHPSERGAKGESQFPYAEIQRKVLQNKRMQNFVDRRLRRSQLAVGWENGGAQSYAVNQLALDDKFFRAQMVNQRDWRVIVQLPVAFVRSDNFQALQMPQRNVLYLSQGKKNPENGLEQEMLVFQQVWQQQAKRVNLPEKFQSLQDRVPLVAYSPKLIDLLLSPLLQKSFPQVLNSFSNLSRQFPVQQMLLWFERSAPENIKAGANYTLHIELTTGSLLLSKGIEAGFRLFLPSLLLRSKQEFIRKQLPNVKMIADEETFELQIPFDSVSLSNIIDKFSLQAF